MYNNRAFSILSASFVGSVWVTILLKMILSDPHLLVLIIHHILQSCSSTSEAMLEKDALASLPFPDNLLWVIVVEVDCSGLRHSQQELSLALDLTLFSLNHAT